MTATESESAIKFGVKFYFITVISGFVATIAGMFYAVNLPSTMSIYLLLGLVPVVLMLVEAIRCYKAYRTAARFQEHENLLHKSKI